MKKEEMTIWDFCGHSKQISQGAARERIAQRLHVCWDEGILYHYFPDYDPGEKYHHIIKDKVLPEATK